MRVLVAPDKFRGTLTAPQAAAAIERGWLRARPGDVVSTMPLADGGEGTLECLVPVGAILRRRVTGPLGDPVEARFGLHAALGVVEMAEASGLALLPAGRRDPRRATTRGTGELMRAAIEEEARSLMVCLGGSATNDGGTGMARALGFDFLDADGQPLREGGAELRRLARIDASGIDPRLALVSVVGVTDVDNPLCGPHGASASYGPQKGASPDDVWELDQALGHLAAIVQRDLGLDLREEPGAGAAGGLGFGLLAFCAARLRRGVEVVMEAVGFDNAIAQADLVITGEGALDEQSLHGKVPAGVLGAAELAAIPSAIVCGRADVVPNGTVVRSLVDRVGKRAALEEARRSLELVAEDLAATWEGR